ncbi:keratin, type I cytoskeletal 9 isoform X1 [Cryptotermes secundus]|uniref:keratin, type I cytoskeletal 9 isoform X1 n=1 Tax=Cryptotermes secundus TaxID=105785 RepID=UPI001454D9EC|nr:keratin, type I cytoskeletal 9 isoform X1 [Cryptotermes secundus]
MEFFKTHGVLQSARGTKGKIYEKLPADIREAVMKTHRPNSSINEFFERSKWRMYLQLKNRAAVRDRRSPTLGLLGHKGHKGHHIGGQYGGGCGFCGGGGHHGGGGFSGSSAQASAGSIGGGQGPHGVSGSQSIASSQSQSATFGFGPFTASFSQSQANAGAGAGGRADYGPGDYF